MLKTFLICLVSGLTWLEKNLIQNQDVIAVFIVYEFE